MEFENARQQQRQQRRGRPQHESQVNETMGKLPPQDLELEATVLGALMLEKDAYSQVSDILSPQCFYDSANSLIYNAISSLGTNQRPIDMLTVAEQLRNEGTLEEIGGLPRITELTSRVNSAANIEYHARIIQQKYLARELISFATQIEEFAFDDAIDVLDLMQEAEGKLFEISRNTLKRDVIQIDPVISQAIARIEEASKQPNGFSGLQTGFYALDKITSGWQNGDLIIIAARPAMGKTALVLSMIKNMAVDYNTPVALFSLEMPNLQIVNRLISNVCSLEGEKIKNGQLSALEWSNLMTRVKSLYSAPIYVDDNAALSIFELRTKARRLVREHGVKLIVIDYLQLMNATGMKFGSREQEVSNISRSLKQLAKELGIPIIALSQLNRSVEQRGDDKQKGGKRPQLSDLRESGAIEQDADIVCFIHRPEYYYKSGEDAEGNDIRGQAEFIIAKHRSGATDTVLLRFVNRYARFENWNDSTINTSTGTRASKMNDDTMAQLPPATADLGSPATTFGPTALAASGGFSPIGADDLTSPPDEVPPF